MGLLQVGLHFRQEPGSQADRVTTSDGLDPVAVAELFQDQFALTGHQVLLRLHVHNQIHGRVDLEE